MCVPSSLISIEACLPVDPYSVRTATNLSLPGWLGWFTSSSQTHRGQVMRAIHSPPIIISPQPSERPVLRLRKYQANIQKPLNHGRSFCYLSISYTAGLTAVVLFFSIEIVANPAKPSPIARSPRYTSFAGSNFFESTFWISVRE